MSFNVYKLKVEWPHFQVVSQMATCLRWPEANGKADKWLEEMPEEERRETIVIVEEERPSDGRADYVAWGDFEAEALAEELKAYYCFIDFEDEVFSADRVLDMLYDRAEGETAWPGLMIEHLADSWQIEAMSEAVAGILNRH